MLETIKRVPRILAKDLFPVKELASLPRALIRAARGELVPGNADLSSASPFGTGFKEGVRGLLNQDKDIGGGGDKERARHYAWGQTVGSAVRSLGALGKFWMLFTGAEMAAQGLAHLAPAVISVAAKQGIFKGLEASGTGLVALLLQKANWTNMTVALGATGSSLQVADNSFTEQAGAVENMKKSMIDGRYSALQGLSILVPGALLGYPVIAVGLYLAFSVAKAYKLARLEQET